MKISVKNAFDPLVAGVMAYPINLKLTDSVQSIRDQININLACNQYNNLLSVLTQNNVKIFFLDIADSPSQVYTRDVGFIVNNTLFISKLTAEQRQPETPSIVDFATKNRLNTHKMNNNIEGGDLFAHNDTIFIGVGDRTNKEAADEIRQHITQNKWKHKVVEVFFDVYKIHLDCTFNILDNDTCIITDGVFNKEEVEKHFTRVIKLTEDENVYLGANIINLGNGKLLTSNRKLYDRLKQEGFSPIFIPFDEVVKASGGLGCCLLPLERGI